MFALYVLVSELVSTLSTVSKELFGRDGYSGSELLVVYKFLSGTKFRRWLNPVTLS